MPTPDVAIAMGIITRKASERIARVAFELATRRRNHLTIVHKANVLQLSMGLFRDVCREVGRGVPRRHRRRLPHRRDDRAPGARAPPTSTSSSPRTCSATSSPTWPASWPGRSASPRRSTPRDRRAMAQAAHGSAPDIAGHDIANPIAMVLSTAMLLEWLGARHDDPPRERSVTARRAGRHRRRPRRGFDPRPRRLGLHDRVHNRCRRLNQARRDRGMKLTTHHFAERVLTAVGVPDDDAALVAHSLVQADRWGHASHGLLRLPWYVDRIRNGAMTAVTAARDGDRRRRRRRHRRARRDRPGPHPSRHDRRALRGRRPTASARSPCATPTTSA